MKVPHGQPLLRFGQGPYAHEVFGVDIDRWWATIVRLLSPPGAGRALRRAARSFFQVRR